MRKWLRKHFPEDPEKVYLRNQHATMRDAYYRTLREKDELVASFYEREEQYKRALKHVNEFAQKQVAIALALLQPEDTDE